MEEGFWQKETEKSGRNKAKATRQLRVKIYKSINRDGARIRKRNRDTESYSMI